MNEKSTTKINPILALVYAMGAFIATSIVFNLVFAIAVLVHIDRFLGGFLQGIGGFAVFLIVLPLSIQASRSRVYPRLVGFVASALLSTTYIFAARYNVIIFTHYLLPHFPGKEVGADMTSSSTIGLLIMIAVIVFMATFFSKPEVRSGREAGKASSNEVTEMASDVSEGVADGIIEQIHHFH